MTTKQIAESVNRPLKTVQTWAKKTSAKIASISAKMASASPTNPADYDIDETCSIIEIGMGKNAASLFRENAINSMNNKNLSTIDSRLDRMEKILETLCGIMTTQVQQLNQNKPQLQSLPAPQIKTRDQIVKLVREYAVATKIEYVDAWRYLYTEFGYRTNSNPTICAKNRDMKIIDYIDAEGQIDVLLSVAMEVLK